MINVIDTRSPNIIQLTQTEYRELNYRFSCIFHSPLLSLNSVTTDLELLRSYVAKLVFNSFGYLHRTFYQNGLIIAYYHFSEIDLVYCYHIHFIGEFKDITIEPKGWYSLK